MTGSTIHQSIAALEYHEHFDAELNALWQAIARLRQQGVVVGGLINPLTPQGQGISQEVESLQDGQRFRILQDLGTGSKGCRLNAQALAESSIAVKQAIEQNAQLVVINKFGVAESEGRGLVNEFAQAVLNEQPVISLVQSTYLNAWKEFSGELGVLLPADSNAIVHWFSQL